MYQLIGALFLVISVAAFFVDPQAAIYLILLTIAVLLSQVVSKINKIDLGKVIVLLQELGSKPPVSGD